MFHYMSFYSNNSFRIIFSAIISTDMEREREREGREREREREREGEREKDMNKGEKKWQ